MLTMALVSIAIYFQFKSPKNTHRKLDKNIFAHRMYYMNRFIPMIHNFIS
jgi:hypothetical protein